MNLTLTTLEYIKKHTRIDGNIEDEVLMLYAKSAQRTILNMLDRTEADIREEYDGEIPEDIQHALCMLVADSYRVREPSSPTKLYTVDYSIDAKLKPYMII